MTKSAMIKDAVINLLSDGLPRTVSDIKKKINEEGIINYSEGQFSGSIDNLLKNGRIEKINIK